MQRHLLSMNVFIDSYHETGVKTFNKIDKNMHNYGLNDTDS